jgi:hypothetical protein
MQELHVYKCETKKIYFRDKKNGKKLPICERKTDEIIVTKFQKLNKIPHFLLLSNSQSIFIFFVIKNHSEKNKLRRPTLCLPTPIVVDVEADCGHWSVWRSSVLTLGIPPPDDVTLAVVVVAPPPAGDAVDDEEVEEDEEGEKGDDRSMGDGCGVRGGGWSSEAV